MNIAIDLRSTSNDGYDDPGSGPGRRLLTMARFLVALFLGLVCLADVPRAGEDPKDAAVVAALVKQTLEHERTGTDLPWSNPDTGSSGVIRVERTYYLNTDTPCRDYMRITRRPNGEKITTRGSGCRMGDGRWFLDEAPGAEVSPPSKAPPAPAAAPVDPTEPTARAVAPAKAPKAEPPKAAALEGKADAPSWDKPAADATDKAPAPAPPPAKPKAPTPDYTLPSRSAL